MGPNESENTATDTRSQHTSNREGWENNTAKELQGQARYVLYVKRDKNKGGKGEILVEFKDIALLISGNGACGNIYIYIFVKEILPELSVTLSYTTCFQRTLASVCAPQSKRQGL